MDEITIDCPYCGEAIDVLVDCYDEPQQYYQDCSVCCAPILFIVSENESGDIQVEVKRDDE
ncbi:MAG: CPXCG motif-containing cysteine-rich protein [Methylobacter sp.]|nr:CPXCG motif-containing cysteine-rich protein [Methylobacter sp.]MDP2427709.1 CPXCG motif-containing cysteine-rich protein [Methylobacter sp.]MDP3055091.1 CPXCG motif-containing cysteine-rich protein [Methylobacter sp.]MDP3360960.1 CPXCG motif-containing cysteine-rich protein [Methylobacter sp.]MDZ4221189.1 CPXCG motif-containing cysteine-rich protein [Methylobacter sp.]